MAGRRLELRQERDGPPLLVQRVAARRCGGCTSTGLRPGDDAAKEAASRTAELFLEHRLFRVGGKGEPIRRSFVALHYPPYWHYDILQALLVLSRMGLASDPRAQDAIELVEERRLADGRWRAGGRWWKPPGAKGGNVEVVDWGRSGQSEMVTLNALRVLHAAK